MCQTPHLLVARAALQQEIVTSHVLHGKVFVTCCPEQTHFTCSSTLVKALGEALPEGQDRRLILPANSWSPEQDFAPRDRVHQPVLLSPR